MADIDVTEVLLDPDFADLVTVRRRTEVVGDDGIGTTTNVDTPGVPMYVMPMTSTTDRRDDGIVEPITVTLVGTFRLQLAFDGAKADQVLVDGNWWTVTKVLPLSRFGAGFCEAEATLMRPASNAVA